jgi:hypothetical protein
MPSYPGGIRLSASQSDCSHANGLLGLRTDRSRRSNGCQWLSMVSTRGCFSDMKLRTSHVAKQWIAQSFNA